MARAVSRPLVAALEGLQVLARDSGRRSGARPSRPDRRASGAFARLGRSVVTRSTAVVRRLSHSDPDGTGRSGGEYEPARPWGTDAIGARRTLGADPNMGY